MIERGGMVALCHSARPWVPLCPITTINTNSYLKQPVFAQTTDIGASPAFRGGRGVSKVHIANSRSEQLLNATRWET
eukprot:2287181-Prymnesium_polylepis.1